MSKSEDTVESLREFSDALGELWDKCPRQPRCGFGDMLEDFESTFEVDLTD